MSDTQDTLPEQPTTVETIEPDATINIQTGVPAEEPAPTVEETPAAPAKKTWYLFKASGVGALTVYDTSVELDADAAQPDNSTPWEPPMVLGTGLVVYWTGNAWQVGADLINAPIASQQSAAYARAAMDFDEAVYALSSGYTKSEQASWKQQVVDAHAVIDGQPASHLLSTLATARGIEVSYLAASIIAKSNAYNDKYATLLAAYQKLRDQIGNATKTADLPAFTVDDVHLI
jgi:hypothetical protein